MSVGSIVGCLFLAGSLCLSPLGLDEGSTEPQVVEFSSEQETSGEGVVDENLVSDTQADGEVFVPPASLETSDDNSSISIDTLAEQVVAVLQSSGEGASLLSLEGDSYAGSISDSILNMFSAWYVKNANIGDSDYLVYRSDQYTYYMVIGNLTLSGNQFAGSQCLIAKYYNRINTGYVPTWQVYTDDVSVDADVFYSYSNLGNYRPLPGLVQYHYQMAILIVLIAFMLSRFVCAIMGGVKHG